MELETATETQGNIIALMSPEALKAVAAARPPVAAALKGRKIHCRSLGNVEGMQQLDQSTVGPNDIIIGFSVPTNLVARAKEAVEVPVGKADKTINPRVEASGRLNEDKIKALIEKLNETGRFALRGWQATATTPFADADTSEVDEKVASDMEVEF